MISIDHSRYNNDIIRPIHCRKNTFSEMFCSNNPGRINTSTRRFISRCGICLQKATAKYDYRRPLHEEAYIPHIFCFELAHKRTVVVFSGCNCCRLSSCRAPDGGHRPARGGGEEMQLRPSPGIWCGCNISGWSPPR